MPPFLPFMVSGPFMMNPSALSGATTPSTGMKEVRAHVDDDPKPYNHDACCMFTKTFKRTDDGRLIDPTIVNCPALESGMTVVADTDDAIPALNAETDGDVKVEVISDDVRMNDQGVMTMGRYQLYKVVSDGPKRDVDVP